MTDPRERTAWRAITGPGDRLSVWPSSVPLPSGWRTVLEARSRLQAARRGAEIVRTPSPASGTPARHDATGESTIDGRVAEICAAKPDHIAVREGDSTWSYADLTRLSAGIADLLGSFGVGAGSRVGILLPRCYLTVATLLGVLSRGAAYVPLDPTYPPDRLEFIAQDARLDCVVTDAAPFPLGSGTIPVIDVGSADPAPAPVPDERRSSADSLAYVMYTSGSTGRPKGVPVRHRNVLAFLDGLRSRIGEESGSRVLFNSRLSFDVSVVEIFWPLFAGGECLITQDSWLPRVKGVADLINSRRPTLVQATPSVWELLFASGVELGPEQVALCGGERLPESLARRFLATEAVSFNVYGPTETTVWTTAWRMTKDEPVSIGDPLAHAEVHLLDADLKEVADGATGEVYIGGEGVAEGYVNDDALTAANFIPDPFSGEPDARLYATGDIARRQGGFIVDLRREDTQVKFRGNRLELGEIESIAKSGAKADDSVALVLAGPPERLAVFIRSSHPPDEVRAEALDALRRLMPPAVVPSVVSVLPGFPLDRNGKVDRHALAESAKEA